MYKILAVWALIILSQTIWAASNRVQVCHIPPDDPANFHTITIGEKALAAHLAHGDLTGPCDDSGSVLCDDGNACTIDAIDQNTGSCLNDHPPVNCSDGLQCTTDSCDPSSGCQYAPINCDDGNPCTIDACSEFDGQCTQTPIDCGPLGVCLQDTGQCDFPCEGIVCDPIDQCHETGACVLPGECLDGVPVEDGTQCNDGNHSTRDDQCQSGICQGIPSVGPDLVPIDISADQNTLSPEASFEGRAVVSNIGDTGADYSTVRFYMSTNTSITDSDTLVGSSALHALEDGVTATITASLVAHVEAGDYYLGVCIDPVPGEADNTNNCLSGPMITVEEAQSSCSAGQLACGDSISNSLSSSDCTSGPLGSAHYAHAYEYQGSIGDMAYIEASWAFDGYLLLEDPNGLIVAENDNHTGQTNSKIELTLSATGIYTVWATSYPPGATGAYDLSLNCTPPSGPDLAPGAPQASDVTPLPSQSIVLATQIWNLGDQDADSTTIHYLMSSDPIIERTDAELAYDGVLSLEAGASRMYSITVSAPATPGTWWLGSCVDAVSGESFTSNNCSPSTPITVAAPPECTTGSINCETEVTGTLNAQDCTDSPRGPGYYAEARTIDLEAGDAVALTASWTGIDGYLYLVGPSGAVVYENDDYTDATQSRIEYAANTSGTFTLWLTTYGREQEGSYLLNTQCGSTAEPDLVVSRVALDLVEVEVESEVPISATVMNSGSSTASATQANVMLSIDSSVTPADTVQASVDVPSLAPGESFDIDSIVSAPLEPGSYWLGVCVYPVTGEILTGNNCAVAPRIFAQ